MADNLLTILNKIQQSDDLELSEIIQAIIRRYGVLHPGWEIMFLSLPREPVETRRSSIEEIITFLRHNG